MARFLVVGTIDGESVMDFCESFTPENAVLAIVPRLELKHSLKPMKVTGVFELGSYNYHFWNSFNQKEISAIIEERDELKFRMEGLEK